MDFAYDIGKDTLDLSSPARQQQQQQHTSLYQTKTPERKCEQDINNYTTNTQDNTEQQQVQLLHWVNNSLQSIGSSSVVEQRTSLATLNIMYELLNQQKVTSTLLENAQLETTRVKAQITRISNEKYRLLAQVNQLNKEVAAAGHKLKAAAHKEVVSRKHHQSSRNDFEIQIRKLKSQCQSSISKIRTKETTIDQLKQRITKFLKQNFSSPRNSPRNSQQVVKSSSQLRQSQQWAVATKIATTKTTTTTSTTPKTLHTWATDKLEAKVTTLNAENQELRDMFSAFTGDLKTLYSRLCRVERLCLVGRQDGVNEDGAYEESADKDADGDGDGDTASNNVQYSLPVQWIRSDFFTIKTEWKRLRARVQQVEMELQQQQEEEEEARVLGSGSKTAMLRARKVIRLQDKLIQSSIVQRDKARRMMLLSSSNDWIRSSSLGTLRKLDMETLKLEEEEIQLLKDWLTEERQLLLDERSKFELKRLKSYEKSVITVIQ